MSFEVRQSTQFQINEMVVVTKAGKIDVRSIFEELSIFDSIMQPCMSGNIVIKDAIGLSNKLLLDGSEFLLVDISKDKDSLAIKQSFHIYKLTNRKQDNQTSETYILHFVSDEYVYSEQQKINQVYDDTYSNAAYGILTDYLQTPYSKLNAYFDNSYGIRNIVIPNLKPIEAISWCAKRALDVDGLPNFLFFENQVGYNFVSLSTLLTSAPLFDVNFDIKNISDSVENEMKGARDVKVISQFDFIKSTRSGVYSGSFVGFDPLTRTIRTKEIKYGDHYDLTKKGNDLPNFSAVTNRENRLNTDMTDSRKTLFYFGEALETSSYVKDRDPTSITKTENPEKFIFQRKAILDNLVQQRVRMTLPGNFAITSGYNLNLKMPTRAAQTRGASNEDTSLSGKYLIIGTRHIITYQKHETVVEVVTDSTNKPFIPLEQSSDQYEAIFY